MKGIVIGLAVLGHALLASAGETRFTLQLEFLRPEEGARALKTLAKQHGYRNLEIEQGQGALLLQGIRADEFATIKAVFARIDLPSIDIPTSFVEVGHWRAQNIVAAAQSLHQPQEEGCAFHAIPQPRTNRVFLMGTAEDLQSFKRILFLLDRPWWGKGSLRKPPPSAADTKEEDFRR